ncbi:MAG: AbrB family transcriptional regulator [Treponema sp.]|nr:AbrB family transcriptional regulator [Treponema sp.]
MTALLQQPLIALFVFYALGIAGWLLLGKLRVPAPAILGPLFFLGAASFFGLDLKIPPQLRPLLSVLLGIILGLRFNLKIKGLVRILLLVSAWLAVLTLAAALALIGLGVDKSTALFASTPGGLTEIALVALSFGTDTFAVTLLQTSRMLLALLVVPFAARIALNRKTEEADRAKGPASEREGGAERDSGGEQSSGGDACPLRPIHWPVLAALGLTSAWLFGLAHIPAPNMMGPMLSIGIYTKFRRFKAKINKTLQTLIQIGVGGIVGLSMDRDSILSLPSYIVPIIALNAIIVGGCLVLAFVLYRMTGWDIATCLIATAPGGMSPMILLALEMGADSRRVTIFQVLRMVLVLLFTPFAAQMLLPTPP